MAELDYQTCDVLIVGASLGGAAAAIRAGEMGATVVIVEESDWIGGQISAQGVSTPDENRWIETTGGTAAYRQFRDQTRSHYRDNHALSESALDDPHLNTGSCWVSRMAVEPKVAHRILGERLASLSTVTVHLNAKLESVEVRINSVSETRIELGNGSRLSIRPRFILDATDLGDVLPLAGVEHVIGAESRFETGEPDAPDESHPEWIQPFTFPFALELRPEGENHTIEPPADYPELKAVQKYHILDGAMKGMFGELGWWTYRRIIAAENFTDPALSCDVAMINTDSNDFKGGSVPSGDPEQDRQTLERARQASLGYVYWLQTECPRADDPSRLGYPELKLRKDMFDTPDGIAPRPYIRESRRIKALRTVLEQEIVTGDGNGAAVQPGPRAAPFRDSCGIGHYWLDIHSGGSGEPGRFLETRPFQIPLGALIPIRVTNLIAACKNLGVTHLTNGAYRLHPIEWNVGESAGALAAFCARNNREPREVVEQEVLLCRFQAELLRAGIPIFWWSDIAHGHPAFVAASLLAVEGLWPLDDSLDFRPDEELTSVDAAELSQQAGPEPSELDKMSRNEAAIHCYGILETRRNP